MNQQDRTLQNIDCIPSIIKFLRKACANYAMPSVSQISLLKTDRPFRVLISCLLSLRTKDEVTFPASERLFSKAPNLDQMLLLKVSEIEKIIYPVGFYKTKAKLIPEICQKLKKDYSGRVPDTVEELVQFKGVGRKTANLVVGLGYGKLAICVDTHVHRISNRLGIVKTKKADDTEMVLRKILPQKYWIEYNDLLVTWGQNICKPISPLCSQCVIAEYCPRLDVGKSR